MLRNLRAHAETRSEEEEHGPHNYILVGLMPVDRTGSDASFEGGRHDVTRSLLWLVLHLVLERPRLLRRPERSALVVVLSVFPNHEADLVILIACFKLPNLLAKTSCRPFARRPSSLLSTASPLAIPPRGSSIPQRVTNLPSVPHGWRPCPFHADYFFPHALPPQHITPL
jgi:hypothetical protein